MLKKILHSRNSIVVKLLVPMLLVIMLQAVVILGAISVAGTYDNLRTSAVDIVNEKTITRRNYLQNEFVERWMNINASYITINNLIDNKLQEKNYQYQDLQNNEQTIIEIINIVQEDFYNIMRINNVSGAFLVLKSPESQKYGLYIRDDDPIANPANYSDLSIEVSPKEFSNKEITRAASWNTRFDFGSKATVSNTAFYDKPLKAHEENPDMGFQNLGYWCPKFILNNPSVNVITYTLPLINKDGVAYGVMGIEISESYFKSMMPFNEINSSNKGSYAITLYAPNKEHHRKEMIMSGFADTTYFNKLVLEKTKSTLVYHDNIYSIKLQKQKQQENDEIYIFVQKFNLYNSNTPFVDDTWILMSIIETKELFSLSNKISNSIVMAVILAMVMGMLIILYNSLLFSRPIIKLTKQVEEVHKDNLNIPLSFKKTKINEIDNLTSAIETLNNDVIENSGKLSAIIDMANVPIAAFEYNDSKKTVYYTTNLFKILGVPENPQGFSIEEFKAHMKELNKYKVSSNDEVQIYKVFNTQGEEKWLQLKMVTNKEKSLGVYIDITKESIEKNKLCYERDFDILTNIYNRRAFQNKIVDLFDSVDLKIAAFIMIDLDNLKYVNDTYGHDYGDKFIKMAAASIRESCRDIKNALYARMAGDEFYIFLYGYETETALKNVVHSIKQRFFDTTMPLPDEKSFRLRVSAGISWYPKDSTNCDELIKFADYAMYETKTSIKGEFHDFDIDTYRRDSYLIRNKEELNRLIDNEMVEYYFQPIVEIKTGEVFAYEALMRPTLSTFKSPMEVLAIAKAQFKLHQIEKLTFFKTMETFVKFDENLKKKKIFINSISNQILKDEEVVQFEQKYSEYLSNIVIEFTENEKINEVISKKKMFYSNRWGCQLALDDYGTGYNGEAVLISLSPNYVKIDMSIIHNINTDIDRLNIVENIITYSKARGIKIIAEGVETQKEVDSLTKMGVDYIQGFYISPATITPIETPNGIKEYLVKQYNKYNK